MRIVSRYLLSNFLALFAIILCVSLAVIVVVEMLLSFDRIVEQQRGLADMAWDDVTEYAPAVVTAIAMPLTYSIATGIGLGFITYAVIKILAGRFADAKPAVLVLALVFAAKFAIG